MFINTQLPLIINFKKSIWVVKIICYSIGVINAKYANVMHTIQYTPLKCRHPPNCISLNIKKIYMHIVMNFVEIN